MWVDNGCLSGHQLVGIWVPSRLGLVSVTSWVLTAEPLLFLLHFKHVMAALSIPRRPRCVWPGFPFLAVLMCVWVSQHRFVIFLMSDGFKHLFPYSFDIIMTLWRIISLKILSLLLLLLLLGFKIPFLILDLILNYALFYRCFLLAGALLFISLRMLFLCLKRPVSLCCFSWPWPPQPLNSCECRHTPLYLAAESFCGYLFILFVYDKISCTLGLTLNLLYSWTSGPPACLPSAEITGVCLDSTLGFDVMLGVGD